MATQDSRIKIKRSTISGTVPTVAPSDDHTQPSPAWIATDIYKGELFINQADNVIWSRGDDGVFCIGGSAELTIASADVLTLNSTPLTIVSAVSGYAIEVVSASRKLDFNTTAYATNTDLQLITSGATSVQAQARINSSVSNTLCMDKSTPALATSTQILANADLLVQVGTGNPTAGDSDITIYVHYRLIPA
jgi:hypothetical protein